MPPIGEKDRLPGLQPAATGEKVHQRIFELIQTNPFLSGDANLLKLGKGIR